MVESYASIRVKVKRAKKHIGELEAEIAALEERNPYFIEPERDEEAGYLRYRLRILEYPSPDLGAIAGDALHNLRSALDILMRAAWYPDGGGEADYKMGFPILDPERLKHDPANGLKGRWSPERLEEPHHKAAVELLNKIKPYKFGNDLLWMLHEANELDKHRLLIPVYANLKSWEFDSKTLRPGFTALDFANRADMTLLDARPIEDGAILYEEPLFDPTGVYVNPKPTLEIAFGESRSLKGHAMLPTLLQIAGEVEGIAEMFVMAKLIR